VKEERSFGGYAFYNIYACADGRHVALAGVEHKFVHNLLGALGMQEHIAAACGPAGPGQAPVIAALRAVFATRTREDWVAWFADKDVCFAPVLDLHEAWAQPQVAARGMLLRDADGNCFIGDPLKFAEEPGRPDLRLPGLDEHGAAIRAELRGA
jgi:crotonobetainyl-CoA:carnitine CoA-transferase CaiB-like acyl-CoA transferase